MNLTILIHICPIIFKILFLIDVYAKKCVLCMGPILVYHKWNKVVKESCTLRDEV